MVLSAEVEELIASPMRLIAALESELADLQRQLGQNSSASFKPPSSDGLKDASHPGQPARPLGQGERRPDGPEGGTLRHAADPDCVLRHEACACGHCGRLLDPKSARGIENRQVFDLAERPLLVTEHQASIYRCEHFRGVTKATFPDGVVSTARKHRSNILQILTATSPQILQSFAAWLTACELRQALR